MKEQTKLNDKTRHPNTPHGGTPVRVQQTQPLADLVQLARERPERLTAVHLTQLQSVLGNRAVNRLVNQHAAGAAQTSQHAPSLVIQPKLQVNAVGDKYEQEADAVAKEVVQKLNTPPDSARPPNTQRQTEEEKHLTTHQIQRQELKDDDMLQTKQPDGLSESRKPSGHWRDGGQINSNLESRIKNATGGQPISHSMRQAMENAFGASFSNVRIHDNHEANESGRC